MAVIVGQFPQRAQDIPHRAAPSRQQAFNACIIRANIIIRRCRIRSFFAGDMQFMVLMQPAHSDVRLLTAASVSLPQTQHCSIKLFKTRAAAFKSPALDQATAHALPKQRPTTLSYIMRPKPQPLITLSVAKPEQRMLWPMRLCANKTKTTLCAPGKPTRFLTFLSNCLDRPQINQRT